KRLFRRGRSGHLQTPSGSRSGGLRDTRPPMGGTRDGLRRPEAPNGSEHEGPDQPLQAILSELQNFPSRRVFRYRTCEERFRKDSQEASSRTFLDSRRTGRGLGDRDGSHRSERKQGSFKPRVVRSEINVGPTKNVRSNKEIKVAI